MTDLRTMALDDGHESDATTDATSDATEAQGPTGAPTDEDTHQALPDGQDSPFYVGIWRGADLYQCPLGDFPGRSHRAVLRHIAAAHPEPVQQDIASRARQAGIILPRDT